MIELAGKQIATTLAEIVEPSRAALLIWDMEYAIGPNPFNTAADVSAIWGQK